MNLAIISNVRGCGWAGSETLWHLAAMQALREGHQVTAMLHRDLKSVRQIIEFREAGGAVHRLWELLSIARFQSLKENIFPGFPVPAAYANLTPSWFLSAPCRPSPMSRAWSTDY